MGIIVAGGEKVLNVSVMRRLSSQALSARVLEWGRVVSFSAVLQALVQGVGFISGLLVIRLLPIDQYAFYTISLAALGMLSVLSDLGVSAAMVAIGGRCWSDPKALGTVLREAFLWRLKLAALGVAIAVPVLFFLLLRQNADGLSALVLCLSILPLYFVNLNGQLLENVVKLHQRLRDLQLIQLGTAAVRLFLVVPSLMLLPVAALALLPAAAAQWGGNFILRRQAKTLIAPPVGTEEMHKSEYWHFVKRTMPGAIYCAFSGQVTIWLVSVFGTTTVVGEVGALGRLAALYAIISALTALIVVPRLARGAAVSLRGATKKYLLVLVFVSGIALGGYVFCFLMPEMALWLLGKSYGHLTREVPILALSSGVGLVLSTIIAMNAALSALPPGYLYPAVGVLSTVVLIPVFPLGTVSGVLWFNTTLGLSGCAVGFGVFLFHVLSSAKKKERELHSGMGHRSE